MNGVCAKGARGEAAASGGDLSPANLQQAARPAVDATESREERAPLKAKGGRAAE